MYSRVPPFEGSTSRWRGASSPRRPTQRHKGLTLFSDEPHHKGLVHLPLSVTFNLEAHIHNLIGGSRGHHTWGTHPQLNWRLPRTPQPSRVKDPRVTRPQSCTSTNPHGESKPIQPTQMGRAEVLKSFTFKFQQSNKCLWGNKRGRTNLCNQCKWKEHKCSNP